jgi:hypothetical protein
MSNFNTQDLSLAATLNYYGYPVIEIIKWKRVTFVFKYDETMQDVENQYWQGLLTVDPLKFNDQLKTLKVRLFATNA